MREMLLVDATSTLIVGAFGLKAPTTLTLQVMSLPHESLPRIVVVPGAFAVTFPFLFTLATFGLSEYQRKLLLLYVVFGFEYFRLSFEVPLY